MIKYTATDSRGRVHKRTASTDRVYTHAVVVDRAEAKGPDGRTWPASVTVSFAGSRRLAEERRGEFKNASSIEIVEAVVVPANRKSTVKHKAQLARGRGLLSRNRTL